MLDIFNYWLVWIAPFLGFSLVGVVIHLAGRNRKGRPAPGKYDTYTCGEPFPDADLGAEDFYRPIKRVLELFKLQRAHTGRLSDYLLAVLAGLAVVLVLVIFL